MLMVLQCALLRAAEPFVTFTAVSDALPIHGATISFSDSENEGVKIAIENLREDMKRVGLKAGGASTTILVGTLGCNKEIDRLKLPDLKGKREKFIITTLSSPLTTHHSPTIVIAGSDRRGTIYGIYELSRQLGVSPWYWWADAPVAQHAEA